MNILAGADKGATTRSVERRHDVYVKGWQNEIIDRCADLDHAAIGESAFGAGPAVWVGNREVAHFDGDSTVDVRLTKPLIRVRRSELDLDERVHLRPSESDWLEVRVRDETDADFALSLIRDAIAANLPAAPSGPPPTGADLARRRRFH
jgi:Family of unknown function (DUF5519)